MDRKVSVTRGTVFVALFLAVLMLGLPSIQVGDREIGAVENAAAPGEGDRALRVSVIELTTAINTLNPLSYTMGQEGDVIFPCYSTLLTRDENAQLIGDLAESWSSTPDGLVWHFDIVHTAKFYNWKDPAGDHSLTWADVAYTFALVRDSLGNSFQNDFPDREDGINVLNRVERGVDDWSFDIILNWQYAPFLSAMEGIPILPKYIWETQTKWNWNNFDSTTAPCVGSGPWYYTLDGLPRASTIELARNPTWFATEERGWQLHVNRLVWKSESSDTSNLNSFQNNIIDVMQYVSGSDYENVIPGIPGAQRHQVSTGFIVEFCMNQMNDLDRKNLGPPFTHASNNQLLLDDAVKEAFMLSVDRQALVDGALDGHGNVGDTLVPDCHAWHYTYGLQPEEDPIKGRAPPGEERVVFNTALARAKLNAAGWTYDELGNYNPNAYPLCKYGGEDVLRFDFFSVSTQTFLDAAARQVMPWFKEAGIDLESQYTVKSSNEANTAWKTANYDVWMWDWIFSPTNEVSLDCLEVMTTMSVRNWNGYFWFNETYNSLYNQSLVEMDPVKRQVIVDEMQRMLYESYGVQHPAYKNDLYAVSTTNGEKWQNWGDWNAHWTIIPEQWYPWLYMQIYPQDNPAPSVTTLEPLHEDTVGNSFTVSMSAVDDDPMEYRFFWGDGTKTGWLASPTSPPKSYSKDGVYTVYLAAREKDPRVGTLDGFIGWNKMTVKIYDLSNLPPENPSFTRSIEYPTSGDYVTFEGNATDPNGDPLYYSWDFGDGHSNFGRQVTHQFAHGEDSTVTMYVDDRHLGLGSRPNQTALLVPVTPNTAPSSTVGNYPNVLVRDGTQLFNVSSEDPDPRDVRIVTWDWGDGTIDVTNLTYGQNISQMTHPYQVKKDYILKVSVDDQTGLPGHNVTGNNTVHVTDPNNRAPVVFRWYASDYTPFTNRTVTFTAQGRDADKDYLDYVFDFGDGTRAWVNFSKEDVAVSIDHVYSLPTYPDIASAYVTVYDNQATPVTSSMLEIEVWQGNRPPVVSPLPEVWADMGIPVTFTAAASDPDGDIPTYWWQFGDGGSAAGNPVTYTYSSEHPQVAYRVWVNDGNGTIVSNVSKAAYIHVNLTVIRSLVKGWNFVSVPFVGHGYKASTLPGLATGDTVHGYDPTTGTYTQNYIRGLSPPSQDFNITGSTGYWINTKAPRTMVLQGDKPLMTQDRIIDVKPTGGWAIIGLCTLKTNLYASNISYEMYSSTGVINTVSSYNPLTGKYQTYIRGVNSTNYLLTPGLAYWIYATADGVLAYDPT